MLKQLGKTVLAAAMLAVGAVAFVVLRRIIRETDPREPE